MGTRFVLPVAPDVQLEGGETISTGVFNLKVLWTPGHSKGHVCLYEPANKLFFSGDHLLPTITPNIGLHPQSSANPLQEFINSLRLIADMDINLILPGHEKPFTGAKERVAHSPWAFRARATADLTSSAVAHSNCPIDSRVTGLLTL